MLSPDRSVHGLLVLEQGRYETISLDLVLPVLHGKLGEDGAMQGLLELSGIPYAGCDVQSSALCMDKSLTYMVARAAGIATPNFWTVTANENIDPDQLTYPVFVKPARSGSSFGVSKASRKEELPSAVETARQYDSKVLIEEAVVGSEVGCAILGNDLDLLAGEVDQIALSHGFFRIHQEDEPETRVRQLDRDRSRGHLGSVTLARSGDGKGRLSRPGMQGTVAGGHVPQGGRAGGPQRGQHAARHDVLQPLSEDDGGRGVAACRSDRPDGVAGTDRKRTMNDDFVFVDELVSGIRWDAKYATWDNFTGKPVDGYLANRIVGTRALCAALERAREEAASLGFGLLLWDGYRPQRAVDCFLRWAQQPEDGRTKLRHYPNIDKAEMFEKGYVAAKSGHTRGSTVDLTLYHLATGELARMGGDYDLMDAISHHGAAGDHAGRSEKPAMPLLAHGGLRFSLLRVRVVALHARRRTLSGHLL